MCEHNWDKGIKQSGSKLSNRQWGLTIELGRERIVAVVVVSTDVAMIVVVVVVLVVWLLQ